MNLCMNCKFAEYFYISNLWGYKTYCMNPENIEHETNRINGVITAKFSACQELNTDEYPCEVFEEGKPVIKDTRGWLARKLFPLPEIDKDTLICPPL